jgi:hypothetical protein
MKHGQTRLKIIQTLADNPRIWFDNYSMAYSINGTRRTVSRIRSWLKVNSLIVFRGRYFKASKILRENNA